MGSQIRLPVSRPLTVLTWLWQQPGGKYAYAAEHVNKWAAMVRRHLSIDHELACVTDLPAGIDASIRIIPPTGDFEDIRLPTWGPKKPQCHRRLSMFRRDAADWMQAERVVSMDLDAVICRSLDPLLDIEDDIKIAHGTSSGRRYNGSLISLRLGSRPQVFETFTPERAVRAGMRHLGSDQSWLAASIPGEKTWTPADGVAFWLPDRRLPPDPRIVFYAGTNGKPWTLVDDAVVAQHYPKG